MRTQGIGPNLFKPALSQNEQQNALTPVKRVFSSPLSNNLHVDFYVGPRFRMAELDFCSHNFNANSDPEVLLNSGRGKEFSANSLAIEDVSTLCLIFNSLNT